MLDVRWALNPVTGVFRRDGKEDRHGGHLKTQAEIWIKQDTKQGLPQR